MSRTKSKTARFNRTDAGNGELFANLFKGGVLYDHRQGRWLFWDAKRMRWQPDAIKKVRLLAKDVAKWWFKIAAGLSQGNENEVAAAKRYYAWAFKCESTCGIDATLRQAETEPPISDDGDGWDADPWLFGVANGVVDLRTGQFRAGTPTDRITKFSPVAFDPTAKCPRWEQFIGEIFDTDVGRFIQKAAGYSMTGDTSEQCLFALHGVGSNGKSTLLELLLYVLGDYAKDLPFTSLEAKQHRIGDGVTLVGARFVKAVEVREGVVLDEGRIKAWTGGDTITVRPFYRNEFSFQPQFKLWLAFNHRPIICDDSIAMWRRLHLVPFAKTFDAATKDKDLPKKLRAEAPGILNWMLAGCLAWPQEGLEAPEAVTKATLDYAAESDHMTAFFEDCCEKDATSTVPKNELRCNYERWCSTHKERPKNKIDFGQSMRSWGFGEGRNNLFKFWTGLRLKTEPTLDLGDLATDPDADPDPSEVPSAASAATSLLFSSFSTERV